MSFSASHQHPSGSAGAESSINPGLSLAAAEALANTPFRPHAKPPLTGVDLSGYMNPYSRQVIDSTLNDLNRQQQIQDQAGVTLAANLPFTPWPA